MSDHSDSYISDDDDAVLCPLCVEEMDITDRSFKPCPCGYQICQFCYNNIRTNPELNGRCPACRRPYDDKNIQYTPIDPGELKAQQMKAERRKREKRQQEKERKDAEMAKRHHLAGVRVIQKNLVYVVGLNPVCPAEELASLLRSEKYFGQYGRILKIVINKRNQGPQNHRVSQGPNPSYGVYVTFARKDDAARCIMSIDGSISDGRILKAAYGTTKYCSSYLRGVPCPNPNCMFLHEPGEEADTFSRQDLSTRSVNSRMEEGEEMRERVAFHGLVSPLSESGHNSPHLTHAQARHPHEPALPSTASWGKPSAGSNSISAPNKPESKGLPSTTMGSFPTLGDALQKAQKQQQAQVQLQQRLAKKKDKREKEAQHALVLNDTLLSYRMIGDSLKQLNNQDEFSYTIKPAFRKAATNDSSNLLLFHKIDLDSLDARGMTSLDDASERQHIRQLVESLLFAPYMKNYPFRGVTHNGGSPAQNQAMAQQAAQIAAAQAAAAGTPSNSNTPVMPQIALQQQQQQHQPNLQQQQQILQQQFLQQQFLQQQRKQAQGANTPPLPGLMGKAHSTELLNQLMAGKKVRS